MLTQILRRSLAPYEEWAAKRLLHLHLRPWHVTLIPPLGAWVAVLPLLLVGRVIVALLVVAVTFPLDAVDGAMARQSQQGGPWGHFCDVLADRVSDAGLLVGVISYQQLYLPPSPVTSFLLVTAVACWFLQSQVTVLMSTISSSLQLGWVQRTERIVVLSLTLAGTVPLGNTSLLCGAALLSAAETGTIVYRCRQAYSSSSTSTEGKSS